eukprot:8062-Pleurochrysis_carterae.AAC.1
MRRWDFVAAYLQGDLEQNEVVYCHAPPGYATVHRRRRSSPRLPSRETDLRHGTSRQTLATLALSVAPRFWLHTMRLRPLLIYDD